MPYGRGGAGNLAYATEAPKEAEKRRIEDPEAARPPTDPSPPPHSITSPPPTTPMTGRGGAGNFNPASPSTTQTQSSLPSLPFHAQTSSHPSSTQLAPQPPKAPVFQGRGGAGNIAAAAAEARERAGVEEEERRRVEERVRESVRREVDGDGGWQWPHPRDVEEAGRG